MSNGVPFRDTLRTIGHNMDPFSIHMISFCIGLGLGAAYLAVEYREFLMKRCLILRYVQQKWTFGQKEHSER